MSSRVTFILNEPRNPKNIGASARGMANFGFRSLAVVNPYAEAWRETRSAVQAGPVVEKAKKYDSLKKAIRGAHLVIGSSAGTRRTAAVKWIGLEELASLVGDTVRQKKRVAILFGSERSGLSNEHLGFCHRVLRIPTAAECPSMNLSQAVAVVACAIRGDTPALPKASAELKTVTSAHVERLLERGVRAFTSAGLQTGWDPARSEDRLRKALYRWNLTEIDVAMLHGLFGWVLKKAGPSPARR